MRISDWSSDVCSSDLTPVSVMRSDAHVGERQARATHFFAWRADLGLPGDDGLALLVHAAAVEDEDAALGLLLRYRDQCGDHVTDANRADEAQRLAEIDRSRPGQLDRQSTRLNSSH